MILQVIFIVYLHYICRALSLQCRSCDQKLDLTVSDINTNISDCKFVDAPYASCSQRLHVRYTKNETSVVLRASSDEPLLLTNEAQIITNTTLIWLTKFQLERIFQIDCFDSTQCEKDTINHTYAEVRRFQYTELWANLLIRLYDASSKPAELVCADDEDKSMPCPQGFCQLTSSDFLTFSRGCIPKEFIRFRLPRLNQFEFCIFCYCTDWENFDKVIAAFRTSFWLEEKHWFVTCQFRDDWTSSFTIFTSPKLSNESYRPECNFDKVICSE
ncbi:unnamed protein product [Adineta steineri]|uniref:Uncharacterized protein n=1 Tax=Adineta steineri TaxID=433720 RepID=A0A813TPM6_9BILA|nr:unnamed protein product [Adineta steineri]